MNTYEIEVEITIRKQYTIDAETEEEAQRELLENGISAQSEIGVPEKYHEDIVWCVKKL